MTLDDVLTEAKLRVVLKTDKKFPPKLLAKIESTGLKGLHCTGSCSILQ